ncbi:PTS-dependent dihydroxyacetone kinase, ADP-binding subunit DhaL [Streptomyces netropsis]|uniref:Dihydroxyacetone kinase phosphoprotein-dependent L subunit n=1 Tax=Streptomyces syringium TaxID=76729 RepID=A0ABS4XZ84_9ACTN|nr:dihydroxyacetone kinase phosphoprotein-dependent L subunit [Streptomyces syringium]SPE48272.1 PTS-dependent dihydroxyacetone kinase, ADP-binding subunit DhaL [Streptomyces netropsis]
MTVTLDTDFFRRFLDRTTRVVVARAAYLTDLDAAIGDADHGANLKRGFTSAAEVTADGPAATPGALLTAVGVHLTNTVGGASGPLFGTVLRRMGKLLGEDAVVAPETLGRALAAAVASVRRLGDSAPGDKTMVDALQPAADAYTEALAGGGDVVAALDAAARAARDGAAATVPMRARRGRASYLGERSVGHQDPGATSSAMLVTALYEATDPALCEAALEGETEEAAAAPETEPQPAGRVGVVLVSHSREVAAATAALAEALVGTGDPAPVAAAGGLPDGGVGTSAELVRRAVKDVDRGSGVVVLCDMGSAVLTVKALLNDREDGFPAGTEVRIADAPFVEGAVTALVTASAGGDMAAVLAATDDARTYRKL